MVRIAMQHPGPGPSQQVERIQTTMRQVSRRQWWHWSSAVTVTLLLMLCIATFAFSGLLSEGGTFYRTNLDLAVRGLVGLVLLFKLYAGHGQLLIHRIQLHLNKQIGTLDRLDRVEERTEQVNKIANIDCLTGLYNRQSGGRASAVIQSGN